MGYRIAYQLYSARDIFDDDPICVLRSLADAGYDGVELAGFCGKEPDYFRGACDALGLKIMSIHLSYWTLTENIPDTVRKLRAYGCEYAAIPGAFGLFIGEERYPAFVKGYTELGRALRDAGITLLYHNHLFEFEEKGGERALEVLYNSFDPELVKAELDCGFVRYSGEDPVKTIKRYRGRVPVLHIKDFNFNEGVEGDFSTFTCPAGEGVLDIEGIIKAGEFSGSEWLVVEQDSQNWRGHDQMECARMSAEYLKKLLNR